MNPIETMKLMGQVLEFAANAAGQAFEAKAKLQEEREHLIDLADRLVPSRERNEVKSAEYLGERAPSSERREYTEEHWWRAFTDVMEAYDDLLKRKPSQADVDELNNELETLRAVAAAPEPMLVDALTQHVANVDTVAQLNATIAELIGERNNLRDALGRAAKQAGADLEKCQAGNALLVEQHKAELQQADRYLETAHAELRQARESNAAIMKDRDHTITKYNEASELLNSRAKQMEKLVEAQVEATIRSRFGATDPAEQLKEVRRLASELLEQREATLLLRKVNEELEKRADMLTNEVTDWKAKYESIDHSTRITQEEFAKLCNELEQARTAEPLGEAAYVAQRAAVMEHALLLLLRAWRPKNPDHLNGHIPWTYDERKIVEQHPADIIAEVLVMMFGGSRFIRDETFGLVPDGDRLSSVKSGALGWKFDMTFNE